MKDFESIYSQYHGAVFQYALSLCRDTHMAEEITQESFFKALKGIGNFRGECELKVWLCQIVKNTFYSNEKSSQRQAGYPLELMQVEDAGQQRVLDKDEALRIHRFLHTMEEPYREVFWMRTFGELSFKEIGSLHDKTESWARVTYHRAKLKIKEGIK